MTPERWRQIERLLQEALEREPAERADFVVRVCAGDPRLREELEMLLASQPSESFLSANALEDATMLLDEEETDSIVGHNFSHYFVESRLGAGGMGDVYLARDLTLGRKVALKLLDSVLADDASSRARFLREAQLAASLDHPNICTIHEVGEADGRPFIAMQYIEGGTLKNLMDGPPLAIDNLLSIVIQVAEALSAAHARGIIHRDIKANNIIVNSQGQAKVLDFGIAKLLEKDGGGIDVTITGQLVGTPAAMSPEQARGKLVDARTDVWSLGVVLYEMITGHAPFAGETVNDVIALVLQREPRPLSHYVSEAPLELQGIVTKALQKDPNGRYQTVEHMLTDLRELKRAQVVQELVDSSSSRHSTRPTASTVSGSEATSDAGTTTTRATSSVEYLVGTVKRHRGVVALGVGLLVMLTVGGVMYRAARRDDTLRPDNTPAPFQKMKITRLTTVGTATAASVSPDGKYVAYAVGEAVRTGYISRWPAGRSSFWVMQISSGNAVEIVPAADVQYRGTTFSRDGEFVYYVAVDKENQAGALYRVSVFGGAPRKILTDIDSAVDVSPDGKQLTFTRAMPSEGKDALMVANAEGGAQRMLAARGGNDWFEADGPAWSPDGRTIACGIGTDTGGTYLTLAVVPVEGGETKVITPQKWGQIGRVAWLGDGSGLVIIAGDKSNPSFTGTTAQVWHVAYPEGSARNITNDLDGYNHASLSVTSDGRSIVVTQEDTSARIWVANLDGSAPVAATTFRQITAGKFEGLQGFSWSPDGRIVYVTRTGDDEDVWVMDGDGTAQRQLTDDEAFNASPVVSPDGRHIYFVSTQTGGSLQIWRMENDGSSPRQITQGPAINFDPSISPDGNWIAVASWRSGVQALWKMSTNGGDAVRLTEGPAGRPIFSPDGKLISCAFFDEKGGKWRMVVLSVEGGPPLKLLDLNFQTINAPAGMWWTPDSRALVYVDTHGGVSNVWKLPLDGKPEQLTNFDSGQIFNLALSHDGRRLAVARGGVSGDVVLISTLK